MSLGDGIQPATDRLEFLDFEQPTRQQHVRLTWEMFGWHSSLGPGHQAMSGGDDDTLLLLLLLFAAHDTLDIPRA